MSEVRPYTDEMLEEAQAYLRERLRNERSMSRDVLLLLTMYAEWLLDAIFSRAISAAYRTEDVETLLAELVERIYEDCLLLAQDEHGRSEAILAFLTREVGGDTLHGRIEKRVGTFFDEVAVVTIAGRLLGKTRDEILKTVREHFNEPWKNPILTEAREAKQKGIVAFPSGLDLSERHYGQGVAISSLVALTAITNHAIAEGWNEYLHLEAQDNGAKGYYVVRGSSYPCDICDEAASFFHSMDDLSYLPCLHPHCVCCAVYVHK